MANSTLFNNGTASNIKTQLESWYANNMTAYSSILESSAGYCNDRTTYYSTTTSSLTTSTIPYKVSSASVYFGPYIRNKTTNSQPSLNCPNTTGYDLLTTSNGLTYPSALLTADEATLAGSGWSNTNADSYYSYLTSGSNYWILSPERRLSSTGAIYQTQISGAGGLTYTIVDEAQGLRPVISLNHSVVPVSGSGTATDPWVIAAP